jgi:hypothetical protein
MRSPYGTLRWFLASRTHATGLRGATGSHPSIWRSGGLVCTLPTTAPEEPFKYTSRELYESRCTLATSASCPDTNLTVPRDSPPTRRTTFPTRSSSKSTSVCCDDKRRVVRTQPHPKRRMRPCTHTHTHKVGALSLAQIQTSAGVVTLSTFDISMKREKTGFSRFNSACV